MKGQLNKIIIALCIMLCISCVPYEYATTQTDIYVEDSKYEMKSDIDFNIVIRFGTPYYYRGSILYYLYNGIYYYPYWYNDYWYVRSYSRPFRHIDHRPYFRPSHNDYRFRPGTYRGYGVPYKRNYDRPRYDRPRYDRPRYDRPKNNRIHHNSPSIMNHGQNRQHGSRNHGHINLGGKR